MKNNNLEMLFANLVKQYLNREVNDFDKILEDQISIAEQNLGFELPKSLIDYYRTLGNCSELNNYQNRILELDKIFIEDGFLIFAEENQNVVYWGIKIETLEEIDPIVWQIRSEETLEFYSEDKTFTEFITELFKWQFNL
jgi:hypothetical protein